MRLKSIPVITAFALAAATWVASTVCAAASRGSFEAVIEDARIRVQGDVVAVELRGNRYEVEVRMDDNRSERLVYDAITGQYLHQASAIPAAGDRDAGYGFPGGIVPVEQILEDVQSRFPGQFLEIELEGDVYEVEWLLPDGVLVELEYAADTGVFLRDRVRGQKRARSEVLAGRFVPLEGILADARARYPGRIVEVELERAVYEVEVLMRDGVKVELKYDARTGTLVESKVKTKY